MSIDAALAVIRRLVGGGTPFVDRRQWRHYRRQNIGTNSVAHNESWEPMTDAEAAVLRAAHQPV